MVTSQLSGNLSLRCSSIQKLEEEVPNSSPPSCSRYLLSADTGILGLSSCTASTMQLKIGKELQRQQERNTLHNTFIGASWMGVMHDGSTIGFGLLAVSASKLCHCWGSPVNFCSRWSKPVWTRCSKLEGPEISSLFFFFPNMVEKPGEVTGKKNILMLCCSHELFSLPHGQFHWMLLAKYLCRFSSKHTTFEVYPPSQRTWDFTNLTQSLIYTH